MDNKPIKRIHIDDIHKHLDEIFPPEFYQACAEALVRSLYEKRLKGENTLASGGKKGA